MQFIGAKGTALFVAIVLIACGAGFGSGLLVGRQHPTHSFQKYGETRFLLDPIAGKLCDPFKDPKSPPGSAVPDLTDLFVSKSTTPLKNGESLDEYLKQYQKPASDYPPACGK